MELVNEMGRLLGMLVYDEMAETIVWVLLVELAFFVAFFALAIHIFRKSVAESEFSSAFYIMKKRHGVCIMEDHPYDYLK